MNHKTDQQRALRDAQLSLKAKGIFALLCMFGADTPVAEIALLTSDGETAIHSALRELIERGYLERTMVRDKQNPRWKRRFMQHD